MPIGSKVYVRAQLVNTNEVFIRYNEMFTKQTAYEAKTVCERHIESTYLFVNLIVISFILVDCFIY